MPGIGESGMTLIGAAIGLAGKKPNVPPPAHVDPQAAQKAAVSGNIAALPDIEKLAKQFDQFSLDEMLSQLEKFSPGITDKLKKIPGIIGDQMKGIVPEDVQRQIKQSVGAKAFAAGFSPGQRASLTAEAIGSTSYDIQQQGVTAAERWMAQVEGVLPRFNYASMFITPAQQIATEQWNEVNRYNQEWLQNRITAMPSPLEQAEMGALQSFGAMVDQYGGAALGSMGGGVGSAFGGSSGAIMFGGGSGGGGVPAVSTGGGGGSASQSGLDWRYNLNSGV